MQAIEILPNCFFLQPGVDAKKIENLENAIGLSLPMDYIDFLKKSNGGEGRVGTAYFLFWPIEKIEQRNLSANIWKYMSKEFLAIGSNGGNECYAFDYTENINRPKFAIISFGDLDPNEKYIIGDSFSSAIKAALAGDFDDTTYNEIGEVELSPELMEIKLRNMRMRANKAWAGKKYSEFITIMDEISAYWTKVEQQKIQYARKFVK